MKFGLDITPELVAVMAAEVKAGEKAVSAAMREAGTDLKSAWRGQITQAGLGRRLANSIRSQTYPKAGESLNAAALVWSKAPVIVGAHDTGPLIRSKDGFWLAIPTAAAGKGLYSCTRCSMCSTWLKSQPRSGGDISGTSTEPIVGTVRSGSPCSKT